MRLDRALSIFTLVLLLFFTRGGVLLVLSCVKQVSATETPILATAQTQTDTLVVGSEQDYPPFALGMTDATADGFTVALWRSVALEAGLNYTIRVRPFHEILQEFKDGKVDILINLAQSEERHQFADFTVPHVSIHGAIFVRKGATDIHAENDLQGKSIIVLNADLAHDYAVAKGWEKQLVLVDTTEQGLRLLAEGKHDAMLLSKLAGLKTLRALHISNIRALDVKAGFTQKFSFAVHKGQADLLARINEGLALTKASGTYDQLYEKWFQPYEEIKVTFWDVFPYVAPVAVILLGFLGFEFYKRQSERKQANEALERMRFSVDHAGDSIFWIDREGRILYANHAACEERGYTSEEMLRLRVFDLDPDYPPGVWAAHFDDLKQRGTITLQTRHRTQAGVVYPIEVNANYVHIGGHEFNFCFLRNITARIRMADELKSREEKFRSIIEISPVPMALNDDQLHLTYLNPAFIQTFGYQLEDIPTLADWWPKAYPNPDYRAQVIATWQARLEEADRDKKPFPPLELNICTKAGEFKTVVFSAAHISGSKEYLVVLFDISERKKAEMELRIAATAFDSQEGMLVTDANNRILRVNSAFTAITGYLAEEVVGKNHGILQTAQQDASFYSAMWESIHATGSWQGEIWNQRKNGEVFPEHRTITAVKDQNNRISNYVVTLTDITLRMEAVTKIEQLAFYDPLTGLPNRRLLQDRLKLALAASQRSGRQGALLFIDMDNFKTLNDTFGHHMGDLLLQLVAQRIETCVRECDTVARLGGDEFVVMLESLSEQALETALQAEIISHKIMVSLNEPYQLDTYEYHSTPSIGVTLFNGQEQPSEELLKQADIAMYQAKISGRNALRFFNQTMQASINARVSLEEDLRLGLKGEQFLLYFQPQVRHNGEIIGAEVLIRWQHPQRGLVPPADFIPLAEETHLILTIGEWVLKSACAQLKVWEANEHTRQLQLAINVSARQFHQADFVLQVSQILAANSINPALLKLELTESLVLDNIDDTISKMNALRNIGVSFAMDDFGTGYSSLSSLNKLPLDQLKIDQSFVREIAVDSDNTVIVETIIAMANKLNMEVIAEGVETEAQRRFLEAHNCLLFQGYLFSRPVPIGEFDLLLKNGNNSG